jgi:hypothetical protein
VNQLFFKALPIPIDWNIALIAKVDEHQQRRNLDPVRVIPLHESRELTLHCPIGLLNPSKTRENNGNRLQFVEANAAGELPFKIELFSRRRAGWRLNSRARH